ncbi:MAG: GNAT family N-acetyltransferase [Thermoplasmata archaeon]|nr:GNAT family N-acetyltransferase [Thermoplasmata archaeon]
MNEIDGVSIRAHLEDGDLKAISELHGRLYSDEFGYDHTFAHHVDRLLFDLEDLDEDRERFWIAEMNGEIVGCVALAKGDGGKARLRFLLVDPRVRGMGLGRKLVDLGVDFARETKYTSIYLTTQPNLINAGKLYISAGFELEWEREEVKWGRALIEQRYEMDLKG